MNALREAINNGGSGGAYAGIGSRVVPHHIAEMMHDLARTFAWHGLVLRTGRAPGADQAFERGALDYSFFDSWLLEIFLPWPGFPDGELDYPRYPATLTAPSAKATEMAERHHPAWERLSPPVQLLMARNCHQVMGLSLEDPVRFVICWTLDGATKTTSVDTGGTGQAIRVAAAQDPPIPVFNLFLHKHREMARELLAL
jgi:hypothetical protein